MDACVRSTQSRRRTHCAPSAVLSLAELGCTLEVAMRYLVLGLGAVFALMLANAPQARAFDTYIEAATNADGSPKFVDPDEQLEALADGT